MDSKELAKKMLEWQELEERKIALEAEIEQAVLEIGKTQTVGNCRATFSNPRKSYQSWEDAVLAKADFEHVKENWTVIPEPYIDWAEAGKELKITRESWIPIDAKPTVKVKLV